MSRDFSQLRREILERFEGSIQAHLDKDVDYIVEDLSDDFFAISEGEVTRPSRDEQRTRFTRYLSNTVFSEYASLMKPEVDISDDGSAAWGRFKVRVKGETVNEDRSRSALDFVCAWLWLYRRVGGRWMRVGEVSTWKQG